MCLSQVIPLKKPHPQEDPPVKHTSPREQLTNRIAGIFEMQRRANQVSLIVSLFPADLIACIWCTCS